ncbi:MAG: hypothetical protein LUH48_05625 [Clostridiales bacterium]|nr:hypothetical protein [Clostridiales bacterium]
MLTKEQIEKRLKAAKLIQAANEAGWAMDPVLQATEEEITGALRSYAAGVHRSEVQGILDAVLPEEGNTGFLLTDDAIYSDCFSSDGAAAMLPLTGLQSVEPVPGSWSLERLRRGLEPPDGHALVAGCRRQGRLHGEDDVERYRTGEQACQGRDLIIPQAACIAGEEAEEVILC